MSSTITNHRNHGFNIIKNQNLSGRTNHIDVRYHFILEKYQEKLFDVRHVPSTNQIADIFTKPLSAKLFSNLSSELVRPSTLQKQKLGRMSEQIVIFISNLLFTCFVYITTDKGVGFFQCVLSLLLSERHSDQNRSSDHISL